MNKFNIKYSANNYKMFEYLCSIIVEVFLCRTYFHIFKRITYEYNFLFFFIIIKKVRLLNDVTIQYIVIRKYYKQ